MKIENAYDSVEVKYSGGTPLPGTARDLIPFLDITGNIQEWHSWISPELPLGALCSLLLLSDTQLPYSLVS